MNDSRNKLNYWPMLDQKMDRNFWNPRSSASFENVLINRAANVNEYRVNNRSKLHQAKQSYAHGHYYHSNESTSVPIDLRERIAEDVAAVRGLYNANPDARNWPSFGFMPAGNEMSSTCVSSSASHINTFQQPRNVVTTDGGNISFSYEFPVYACGISRQELDLPQNMVAMLQKTSQNVFGLLQNVD